MKLGSRSASAALLALVVACGGGGDSGTPPANEPPTVTFTTSAFAVVKNVPVDLTIGASDADGDPLTITWEVTRGLLTPQNAGKTVMEWSTPSTVGTDTVTVRVSDGTVTRSIAVEMKVATLTTSNTAPATYSKTLSPYIVRTSVNNHRILIPGGTSGTVIEAGVELYIDTPGTYFTVLDDFIAHGTPDEPIVIRPNNRTLSCAGDDRGWWDGIQAASDDAAFSTGVVDFAHVEVWYARMGVRLDENANAILRDCRIRCSGENGLLVQGSGSLQVFDSQITDGVSDGISIAAISSLPDSVRIERCNISFNGNAGIRMDLNDFGQAVPIRIEFNEIEFNSAYGISLANSVFPSIHYNSFRGNGDTSVVNLYLVGGYPDPVNHPVLDATCNYWGSATSTQASIDASIRDSLDTSAVHTRVDSSPWLNANPITTPPSCP